MARLMLTWASKHFTWSDYGHWNPVRKFNTSRNPTHPSKEIPPNLLRAFYPPFPGGKGNIYPLGWWLRFGLRETRTINRSENHFQSIFTGWHKLSGLELKETSTLWKISNFHLPSPKCPLSPISEGEGDKGQPPKNEDFYRWGSPDLSDYCHFTHTSSYRL